MLGKNARSEPLSGPNAFSNKKSKVSNGEGPYSHCESGFTLSLRFDHARYNADLAQIRRHISNGEVSRLCIFACVPEDAVADCTESNGLRLLVHPVVNMLYRHRLAVLGLEDRSNNRPRIFPCAVGGADPSVPGNHWHFDEDIGVRVVRPAERSATKLECDALSLTSTLRTLTVKTSQEKADSGLDGLGQLLGSGPLADLPARRINRMLGRPSPDVAQISAVTLRDDIRALLKKMSAYPDSVFAGKFTLTIAEIQGLARIVVASIEALKFDRVAFPVLQSFPDPRNALPAPQFAPTRQVLAKWGQSLGQEWLARHNHHHEASLAISRPPAALSLAVRRSWQMHQLDLSNADNYAAGIEEIRTWLWNHGNGHSGVNVKPWKVCVKTTTNLLCLLVHRAYNPFGGVGKNPLYVIGVEVEEPDRAFWFATSLSRGAGNKYPWESDLANRWNINWQDEAPEHRIPIMKEQVVDRAANRGTAVRFSGSYGDMGINPKQSGATITQTPISADQLRTDVAMWVDLLSHDPPTAAGFVPGVDLLQAMARLVVVTMEAVRFDYIACNVRTALRSGSAAFLPPHSSVVRWCRSLGREEDVHKGSWIPANGGPVGVPEVGNCPAMSRACA